MEKFGLKIYQCLKKVCMDSVFACPCFPLLAGPGCFVWQEKGKESFGNQGKRALETISRESGIPVAYLIESLKLPNDVPLNVASEGLERPIWVYDGDCAETGGRLSGFRKTGPGPSNLTGSQKGTGRECEKKRKRSAFLSSFMESSACSSFYCSGEKNFPIVWRYGY